MPALALHREIVPLGISMEEFKRFSKVKNGQKSQVKLIKRALPDFLGSRPNKKPFCRKRQKG